MESFRKEGGNKVLVSKCLALAKSPPGGEEKIGALPRGRKRGFNMIKIITILLVLIPLFLGCTKKKAEDHIAHQKQVESSIEYWTCSMHPSVRKDGPGECPICGMDLIPVYKEDKDKIVVEKKTAELVGIKSVKVQYMNMSKTIRLPGKVANDNELYIAQQEYITSFMNIQKLKEEKAEEQQKRLEKILQSSALRLKLLGFDEKEIYKLQKKQEPDINLIYPGEKVWIIAEIYEYDLSLVKIGQNVVVTTPTYPKDKFYGVVRAIEPVLNPETRSAKARIEVINTGSKLKLEMFVTLEIIVNFGKTLAIPRQSLIDTGIRKIVYVDLGEGRYKMVQVKTGYVSDDYVQIIEGLKEGDMVVTDGNFMLDSQATLTGGASLLYGSAEEIKGVLPKGREEEKKPVHKH